MDDRQIRQLAEQMVAFNRRVAAIILLHMSEKTNLLGLCSKLGVSSQNFCKMIRHPSEIGMDQLYIIVSFLGKDAVNDFERTQTLTELTVRYKLGSMVH